MTARVMCAGSCDRAEEKYRYAGIPDCSAAARLAGGAKTCRYGCLGLGSCAAVCEFGAISVENGVAAVDSEKCTACGKCAAACPKKLIQFVPKSAKVHVLCSNEDKGAAVNKYCSTGCIGCGICAKNCPKGAIEIKNNRAVICYEKCIGCGICAEKCPKKVIHID